MNLANTLDIEAEYKISYLLTVLTKNRLNHINEYAEAKKGYDEEKAAKLKALMIAIRKGADAKIQAAYNSYFSMKTPIDAKDMYDEYISILSNSASDTVKLSISDANAIINDKWSWATAAKTINSTYFKG
jgi:hypothetical protein